MIAPHIAKWALDKRHGNNDNTLHAGDIAVPPSAPTKKRKKYERVLETKGGGGYVPPPQPSPQEQAAARDWEAQQEFEREQRRQDAIDRQKADEKAAADAAWQSGRGAAYNAARTGGANRLASMGIQPGDPYGVYSAWSSALDQANSGLTTGADYSSAFSPTMLDEQLGSARTGQRNRYRSAFNTQVSPYYAEETFGSTRDDPILAAILSQQYNDAIAELDAAKGRGQATQSVYDRSLRDLGTAKATANTTLQGIGGNILSGYQSDVNRRRQSALDRAAEWDFGTTYDPAQEAQRVTSYAGERGANLEGDIRGAVGGQEFFDVNSILGNARARVGTQTTPTTTGGAALTDTFQNQAQNDAAKLNEGIF